MSQPRGFEDKVAFVWRVADKLRGHFKPHEYGSVMLPLLVLRRLDAVLDPTKAAVLAKAQSLEASGITSPDPILRRTAGQSFYNTSPLSLTTLLQDDKNVAANLRAYVNAFSPGAVEVLEEYRFDDKVTRLDRAGILYQVLGDFADLDLHPDTVSNEAMGAIFEELLRKFAEMSNETAGEHYTPREVIRLMVSLLFAEDADALAGPAPIRTVYDPAAGTGGMLTVADAHLTELNPAIRVEVFGQELNPETWAIARSDLMIKGADPDRMVLGNSLTNDGWAGHRFDYMLANPPYGVDWKAYADPIKREAEQLGFAGRFGAGLPRISDGSFLFLQHMLSHMKPVADDPNTPWVDGGSRVGIVLSGSPLFSGAAGSGESEIRRWIIENDWLEGIVALPDQMFYNTGINTYVWILTNRKHPDRTGTVTLIDARDLGTKMRKSLGDKRKELTPGAIDEITRLYIHAPELSDGPEPDPRVKVLANQDFGFARITVERPMRRRWEITTETLQRLAASRPMGRWAVAESTGRSAEGWTPYRELVGRSWHSAQAMLADLSDNMGGGVPLAVIREAVNLAAVPDPDGQPIPAKKGGGFEPDPSLRDAENIPLPAGYLDMSPTEQATAVMLAADEHLKTEIHPYVPDAWIDHTKTRIGYEIPVNRHFYIYTPPRPVAEIRDEIDALETQIQQWMQGLAG
ncbi:MAG: type I restriction-modification system subunit M [Candidatus Nanopelagicales bacterium]|nr:type I restriction-modification system subunit M [Candidatus Nanopelagicales bacterium]MCU0294965.1 type I restriction-modification system subunit M [Candidatus Nanopelagicales bacterium]